jgi:hypothetical protein
MNIEVNDVIIFEKGSYLVLDVIKNENNTYLYLINNDDLKDDIAITKVTSNNGNNKYSFIDSQEEYNYVLNKLFLDFKNNIISIATNE